MTGRSRRIGWGLGVAVVLAAPPLGAELETRFTALSQIDWVAHRQSSLDALDVSTGVPLNEDRFVLRRARAGYRVEHPRFAARGELEVQGERELTVSPYELSLEGRWAHEPFELEVALALGLLRIPFGFDVVERVEARPVLERTTFARALFPGQRDLGAGIDLRFSVLRVWLSWMNGEPAGERRFAGLDRTSEKDLIGRFGIETRFAERWFVSAGVSGLEGRGLHAGTPATKDRLAWNDGNEDGRVELAELSVIPGVPATPSESFSRFAIGADVRLTYDLPVLGALELRAEIVRAKNLDRGLEVADPVSRGRDLRELGWCVGVAQALTSYGQIAVRYDVYDPDSDSRRQWADRVVPVDARYRTLAVALSGRVEPFRVLVEYDHRKNALGVSETGAPATLADDSLTVRGEFVY